jgi:hypothetical protein
MSAQELQGRDLVFVSWELEEGLDVNGFVREGQRQGFGFRGKQRSQWLVA